MIFATIVYVVPYVGDEHSPVSARGSHNTADTLAQDIKSVATSIQNDNHTNAESNSSTPSEWTRLSQDFALPLMNMVSANSIDRIVNPQTISIAGNQYRLSLINGLDTAYNKLHLLCPVGTIAIYQVDGLLAGHAKVWCTWKVEPPSYISKSEGPEPPHPAVSINGILVEEDYAVADRKNSSFSYQQWAKRIGC